MAFPSFSSYKAATPKQKVSTPSQRQRHDESVSRGARKSVPAPEKSLFCTDVRGDPSHLELSRPYRYEVPNYHRLSAQIIGLPPHWRIKQSTMDKTNFQYELENVAFKQHVDWSKLNPRPTPMTKSSANVKLRQFEDLDAEPQDFQHEARSADEWLSFIEYQLKINRSMGMKREQIVQLAQSMYHKSLQEHPRHIQMILKYMDTYLDIWRSQPSKVFQKWRQFAERCPESKDIWLGWVDAVIALSAIGSDGVWEVLENLDNHGAFRLLQVEQSIESELAFVHVAYKLCLFLRGAGYQEIAVQVMESLVHLNLSIPEELVFTYEKTGLRGFPCSAKRALQLKDPFCLAVPCDIDLFIKKLYHHDSIQALYFSMAAFLGFENKFWRDDEALLSSSRGQEPEPLLKQLFLQKVFLPAADNLTEDVILYSLQLASSLSQQFLDETKQELCRRFHDKESYFTFVVGLIEVRWLPKTKLPALCKPQHMSESLTIMYKALECLADSKALDTPAFDRLVHVDPPLAYDCAKASNRSPQVLRRCFEHISTQTDHESLIRLAEYLELYENSMVLPIFRLDPLSEYIVLEKLGKVHESAFPFYARYTKSPMMWRLALNRHESVSLYFEALQVCPWDSALAAMLFEKHFETALSPNERELLKSRIERRNLRIIT